MSRIQIARYKTAVIAILLCLVLLSLGDLAIDWREGASLSHLLQEGVILLLCLMGLGLLFNNLWQQQQNLAALRAELAISAVPAASATSTINASDGSSANPQPPRLRDHIQTHLDNWQLTKSEQEVAWLLLKGLSLSEIASLRETQEKTVRQQASNLYKKAGVPGRHALAAWFFEDVM